MSRLSTKQREARRFRRIIQSSVARQDGTERLSGMVIVARRLRMSRLWAQGWSKTFRADAVLREVTR